VICWLVAIYIPLFGVSILLYLYTRRAKEHPIIARLWLIFAAGQACGVLSAACALVGKGDFQAPASLFDALWSTCVTFAFHSASRPSIRLCCVPSTDPDRRLGAQFNLLYPIPIRAPPYRDEIPTDAEDPLTLSCIPLVPVISGHCVHCSLRSPPPERIFARCRILSPRPLRRSQRSRSLSSRRRGRKVSLSYSPRPVTRHPQT
jgi:hypothetical protein